MKKIPAILAAAWLGFTPLSMAGRPYVDRTQQILSACSQTAARYAYVRDQLLYDAYGDLFTEDAVFAIGAREVVGRAAIIDAAKARGAKETTRHFITPVHMEVIDNRRARGVSYLALYSAVGDLNAGSPLAMDGPAIIGEYHDEFQMTPEGCKFSARRVKLVFTRATPRN